MILSLDRVRVTDTDQVYSPKADRNKQQTKDRKKTTNKENVKTPTAAHKCDTHAHAHEALYMRQ